jgi:hypothetical protein
MDLLIFAAGEVAHLSLAEALRGLLVVVFAAGLFCGSVYLLLATDVGSRIGFLLSIAALSGFISMLAMIWSTSQFPLNSLHGPAAHWKVMEVAKDSPDASKFKEVHDIQEKGRKAETTVAQEVKATVDATLTAEGEFQSFAKSTDYLITGTREIGGGRKGLFKHRPLFAVAEVRPVKKVDVPVGSAPPTPEPDTTKPAVHVVLERDLGALRLPQYLTVIGAGIIFVISLLLLHSAERGRQAGKEEEKTEPEPSPEPVLA